MKRCETDKDLFSIIQLVDGIARRSGRELTDATLSGDFLMQVSQALAAHRQNPMRLHGLRTQAMFAHVASALGSCRTITEEDAGMLFATDQELRRPDFRVVTKAGEQFVVEVKNCHSVRSPVRLRASYVAGLKKYAECMGVPLKIAVYWSRWHLWTLVGIKALAATSYGASLDMCTALKANEMSVLGDLMIGTMPPLILRLCADQSKPCTVGADGSVPFTIKGVEFFAGRAQLHHKIEKDLAWFFMRYGGWSEVSTPTEVQNGKLIHADLRCAPAELDCANREEFSLLGFLSTMISRQYTAATTREAAVSRLTPTLDADAFGVTIPPGYDSDTLRLWQFELRAGSEKE